LYAELQKKQFEGVFGIANWLGCAMWSFAGNLLRVTALSAGMVLAIAQPLVPVAD